MAQQPHRLSQGPAGEGVRAEAPVVHRKAHFKARIAQVGVVLRQHLGAHHALVHNGAAAQRGHVKITGSLKTPGLAGTGTDPATQAQQQSLEGVTIGAAGKAPLLDHWGGVPRHGAQHGRIHWNHPPAGGGEAERLGFLIAEPARQLPPLGVLGHEHHPETTGGGRLRPDRFQISPGDLAEHAGTIT